MCFIYTIDITFADSGFSNFRPGSNASQSGAKTYFVVQGVQHQGHADKVVWRVFGEVLLEFADGCVHLHRKREMSTVRELSDVYRQDSTEL